MQRGCNALHLSIDTGHLDIAQYLATKMGDHLYDCDNKGDTALHKANLKSMWSLVNYLEECLGSDVTVRSKVSKERVTMQLYVSALMG